MMHENSPPTLDEVLQEFIAAEAAPTAEHVRTWINRYPQFEREIIGSRRPGSKSTMRRQVTRSKRPTLTMSSTAR